MALNNKTSGHSNEEEATNDRSAYIDEQIKCFRESHSSKQSDIFAFRAYAKNLIELVKPFSGLPEEFKDAYTAIEEEIDKLNKDLRQASMEKRFDRVQELANQLMLCQMRLEQEREREKDMFVNWTQLCPATCDVITGNAQRLKQILIKSLEGSTMAATQKDTITRHEHSIPDHKGQADPIDPPPPYSVIHNTARSLRTSKRRRLSEDTTEVSKLSQSKKEDKQTNCEEAAENAFSDREEAVTKSRQGLSGGMPRDTNVQEYTDFHTSPIPENVSEWSDSLDYFDGDDSEDEDFRETRGVCGRKYHQWDCDCELCILTAGEAEEDDVS